MASSIILAAVVLAQIIIRHLVALQHRAERAEWREERGELLNRIQHPEVIIQPQALEIADETPVDLEDDREYWRARGHVVD